jgi:hypothetical protein
LKKVKAILMGFLFLVLAAILAVSLTVTLLMNNYKPDPEFQIILAFVGAWLLFCGFYFREKRVRWGAAALLGLSFAGLVIKGL